jgi:septal ring factor EnvC (AmiA/AmiB activator)
VIFGLMLILCLCTPALGTGEGGPAAEVQRAKLESLRTRIAGLRAEMDTRSGEKSALARQLQESEQTIGGLARRLRVLDDRLSDRQRRLEELRARRGAQTEALAQQRAVLARQVRAAYAMGRQEKIKILLNQQDPATVGRTMIYYDYLSRARARKIESLREQLQRLMATEREIQVEEQGLVRLRDEQASQLLAMQASQDQRRSVMAQLTAELQDQGRQLASLQSDERELNALIKGLEQALADIPVENPQQIQFAGLRGRLPWPASGRIVSRFGTPRLGGLLWDGVMISAPEGREVRAVHHGRVAFADWLRGFGLLMIVDHGDGYMTLYGHNQSLFKEVGDWVEADEAIALVGNSGGRERAGVYFGIRFKGRPVNPTKWCRRMAGSKVG